MKKGKQADKLSTKDRLKSSKKKKLLFKEGKETVL
jgi:hypothetical protein